VFSVRAALRVFVFLQTPSVRSSYGRDLIYNDQSQSRYSNECNGNKRNRKVCFTADLPKRKENNMAKLNRMSSVSDCRYTWTFFFILPAIDTCRYMFVEVNWPGGSSVEQEFTVKLHMLYRRVVLPI